MKSKIAADNKKSKFNDLAWMTKTPIAHRGLHDKSKGIIENSLSAVKAAVAQGFSIEVDLHFSADKTPFVFHDDNLERLTDKSGPVRAHSAKELSKIKLGGTGDHIPTLRELLETVNGKSGLVLELKGIIGKDEGFVGAVLQQLDGYQGPVAIMSFDHWLLVEARALGSEIPVGLTAEGDDSQSVAHQKFCDDNTIDFVSYGIADLPNSFIEAFRGSGKPVITWTIKNIELMRKSQLYADQITFEGFDPRII